MCIYKYWFFSRFLVKNEISEKKPKKLSRSLTFSSLLPISSKKGKLKISKFGTCNKLKSVEENSELTSFCDSLKRNTTFKDKVMNKDTVTESNMRRLSMVCNEIDKFEREFVEPVRISASSLSLSTSSYGHPQPRKPRYGLQKHLSTNLDTHLKEMRNKFLSSDSVTSGYDSGAFSRESTPDLSLSSSLTDSSEQRDLENNLVDAPKSLINFESANINSVSTENQNLTTSTPCKPRRSLSERVQTQQTKVPLIRRSHTTTNTDTESLVAMMKKYPAIVSRVGCSSDCGATVTVNGFCYH